MKNRTCQKPDLESSNEQIILCPESKLKNLHWRVGIKFVWPEGYNDPLDYCFDSTRVIEYTPKNIFDVIGVGLSRIFRLKDHLFIVAVKE